MLGIYLGKDRLQLEDVTIYPLEDFCKALFQGEILG